MWEFFAEEVTSLGLPWHFFTRFVVLDPAINPVWNKIHQEMLCVSCWSLSDLTRSSNLFSIQWYPLKLLSHDTVGSIEFHTLVWTEGYPFRGNISWSENYSAFFCYFKFVRLHVLLFDAFLTVRSCTSKGSGYFYLTGKSSQSFLVGRLTGLIFSFYLKVFPSFIFQTVNPWRRMSCILLDIEFTHKNFLREFGVFSARKCQGYCFRHPQRKNQKEHFLVNKTVAPIWVELWNFLLFQAPKFSTETQRGWGFWKWCVNARFWPIYSKKARKTWIVVVASDIKIFQTWKVVGQTCVWSSYTLQHKSSLDRTEPRAKIMVNVLCDNYNCFFCYTLCNVLRVCFFKQFRVSWYPFFKFFLFDKVGVEYLW